jgi:hypothetical protein
MGTLIATIVKNDAKELYSIDDHKADLVNKYL